MPRDSIPPLPVIPGVHIKQIPGWPKYAATTDGKILSCKIQGKTQKFMDHWAALMQNPCPNLRSKNPRYYVGLYKNGRQSMFSVHKLILETFVGPCPEGMESCHWNDDGSDNRLTNLRWDTRKNNVKDKIRNGRTTRGGSHGQSVLNEQSVLDIRRLASTVMHRDLAERFGVSNVTISNIVHRATWSWLH